MPSDEYLRQRTFSDASQRDAHVDAARPRVEAGLAWGTPFASTSERRDTAPPARSHRAEGVLAPPPEAVGALVRSEQGVALTVTSLGIGIEALADVLGGVDALPRLANEYLSDLLVDGPPISLQTWLHSLLYLGRVIAPACRDALVLGDLLRGRMLVAELLQAAPTVIACAHTANLLSRGAPDDLARAHIRSAAPILYGALVSDRAVACLAKLHADLGALAGWLARSSATDGLPSLPPLAQPSALGTTAGRIAGTPLTPTRATRSTPIPATPSPAPITATVRAVSLSAATGKAAPPSVWRPPLDDGALPTPDGVSDWHAGEDVANEPWPADLSAADSLRKRRIFATVVACVLLALAATGGARLWWNAQAAAAVPPPVSAAPTPQQDAAIVNLGASPQATATEPPATATTVRPTPPPTAVPAAQAPQPEPTHVPIVARAAPAPADTASLPTVATPSGAAVTPGVSALTLICGGTGAALPLRNSSGAILSWSLVMPPNVKASGTSGMVNPGRTLTIYLRQTAGNPGTAMLYVVSGGRRTPVSLTLLGC